MEQRPFGSTGLEVGVLGLGGAGFGGVYGPVTDEEAVAAIHQALDLGVTYFDTAPSYGESERRLGLALADRREGVVLATKAGLLPDGSRELTYDGVLRSVEASLARLGTDRLDLLQYHEIKPDIAAQVLADNGPLGALRRLREEGVTRWLGITGRDLPTLAEAVRTGEFVSVLTYLEYSPLTLAAADLLFPVAAEKQVAVIAGSPLAAGLLAGDLDGYLARRRWPTDRPVAVRARRVYELAAATGWAVSDLALAFELADPRVTVVIPGARTAAEAAANVRAVDRSLPPEVLAELREIARS